MNLASPTATSPSRPPSSWSSSWAPRAAVLFTGALLAVLAASCKDEKVRVPFTAAIPPASTVTGPTPIYFTVRDKPNQFVAVSVDVSADGGLTYAPATAAAGSPSQVVVAAAPAGASGFFFWDPVKDLGPGIHRQVTVRVSAYGRDFGVPGDTGLFTVDLTDRLDPVASGGDARALPVAAPLPDDRVWVTGGEVGGAAQSGGFIYDPRTNALTSAAGLSTPRTTPGWALLRDGRVLVAGGAVGGAPSGVTETFSLTGGGASGQVTTVPGGLGTPRVAPAVAALSGGRALVIGGAGAGGAPVGSVELFTPGAGGGAFSLAFTDPATARLGATATTLPDGRVLVVGGVDGAGTPQATALLIDANGGGATATGADIGRAQHAAVLLPDGRVFVAGGTTVLDDANNALTVASIYDPATGTFRSGGVMQRARLRPGMAYAGGHVVVFGGAGGVGAGNSSSQVTAERYDLETTAWTDLASHPGTARAEAVAVATGPGRALVVGGGVAPEVYTPDAALTTQAFDPILSSFPAARADHTATLLSDGTVLFVGGTDGVSAGLSTVERYVIRTGVFEPRAPLARGRAEHAAALTATGLLVVGGRDASGLVAQAEVHDPLANTWSSAGALATPRARATAVVLADGTVLVSGGVDGGGAAVLTQERWDPFTRTFTAAPAALSAGRFDHQALSLNGVAVVGPGRTAAGFTAAVDVFRPNAYGLETAVGAQERGAAGLTLPFASPLVALVSGGEDAAGPRADAAFLDLRQLGLATPAFLSDTRPLLHARAGHEAVPLPAGTQVLLSGGRGPRGGVRDEGEVYRFTFPAIEAGAGEATNDRRAVKARARHTATLLSTGRVLIVGGVDERGVVISGAELFLP